MTKTQINKVAYTPTPWQIAYYGESERAVIKVGSLNIAHVDYVDDGENNDKTHGNAAFIVRACNAHADLVEACKLLLCGAEQAQKQGVIQPQLNGGVVLARAILGKLQPT